MVVLVIDVVVVPVIDVVVVLVINVVVVIDVVVNGHDGLLSWWSCCGRKMHHYSFIAILSAEVVT